MSLAQAQRVAEQGLSFDFIRKSGLFPPRAVLNSFFLCGVDDAASDEELEWEPFELGAEEYGQFHAWCSNGVGSGATGGHVGYPEIDGGDRLVPGLRHAGKNPATQRRADTISVTIRIGIQESRT